jgi:hypothetical protein
VSGAGKGSEPLRTIDVTTNADGNASGTLPRLTGTQPPRHYTATATALRSMSPLLPLLPAATSEFSNCRFAP